MAGVTVRRHLLLFIIADCRWIQQLYTLSPILIGIRTVVILMLVGKEGSNAIAAKAVVLTSVSQSCLRLLALSLSAGFQVVSEAMWKSLVLRMQLCFKLKCLCTTANTTRAASAPVGPGLDGQITSGILRAYGSEKDSRIRAPKDYLKKGRCCNSNENLLRTRKLVFRDYTELTTKYCISQQH